MKALAGIFALLVFPGLVWAESPGFRILWREILYVGTSPVRIQQVWSPLGMYANQERCTKESAAYIADRVGKGFSIGLDLSLTKDQGGVQIRYVCLPPELHPMCPRGR